MEESILGQRQTRTYLKCFSESQWGRVSRATMMLGVQYLMMQNPRSLAGDFSHLGLDDLEDLVIENEVRLLQTLRQQRAARSRSRGAPAEGGEPAIRDEPQQTRELPNQKKEKRVTVLEASDEKSSPAPHPLAGSSQRSPADKVEPASDPLASKAGEAGEPQPDITENQAAASGGDQDALFLNVNRRHRQDFNKHKSSQAMKTLLKADEGALRRQRMVPSGSQITSKVEFEAKRSKEDPPPFATPGILNYKGSRTSKSKQPSQKNDAKQAPGVAFAPEDPAKKSVERERSREPSRGRASSGWRQGVTRESLERQAQESAQKKLENRNKPMVYPSWWQGREEIERSQKEKEQQGADKTRARADPIRARVHKNLNRYAEDSLDARLRQVRQHAGVQQERPDTPEDTSAVSLRNRPVAETRHPAVIHYRQGDDQPPIYMDRRPPHFVQTMDQNQSLDHHVYPSFDQYNPRSHGLQHSSLQSSQAHLNQSHYAKLMDNRHMANTSSSSMKDIRMLDSAQHAQVLNRTNGSASSFAYTSGKNVPKYSPARQPKPGASNIPMSYAGPPSHEEMNRNAQRYASGNRNFTIHLDSHDQLPEAKIGPRALAGDRKGQYNLRQQRQVQKKGNKPTKQGIKNQKDPICVPCFVDDSMGAYHQQQLEAQKNRMKNQNYLRNEQESAEKEDSRVEDGVAKYARGGVAITISSVPQEERSRSGSQPRYPFMDKEPFRGASGGRQDAPQPEYGQYDNRQQKEYRDQGHQDGQGRPRTGRRLPKELSGVESTLKSKIDQDKRTHLEKQRMQELRDYQDQMDGEHQEDEANDPGWNRGPRHEIFYKKDDSKIVYEEGQDTYRPVIYQQHSNVDAQDPSQSKSQIVGSDGANTRQGASLRRRTISPQTRDTIQRQQQAHNDTREQEFQYQPQPRSSYDYHNETGFTNKLMRQHPQYGGQPGQRDGYEDQEAHYQQSLHGYGPDTQAMQTLQQQEQLRQGEYRSTGRQHQYQNYFRGQGHDEQRPRAYFNYNDNEASARGEEGYGEESQRDSADRRQLLPLSSGDKNNTSRFAFSNDQQQQSLTNPPPNRQGDRQFYYGQNAGHRAPESVERSYTAGRGRGSSAERRGGPNSSTFNDQSSSLVTPNLSHGGAKLQNQLEVLMMKSGEFSAGGPGGPRDREGLLGSGSLENIEEEGLDDHDRSTQGANPNEQYQDPRPFMNQQNYGNPNFLPPQSQSAYGHGGQPLPMDAARGAFNDVHAREPPVHSSQQQRFYKDQYPATYQQYEQSAVNTNSDNFSTSQFAGNQLRSTEEGSHRYKQAPESAHSKTNSRTRFGAVPLNEIAPASSAVSGNNFTLQRPSAAQGRQEQDMADMPKQNYFGDPARGDRRDDQYRDTLGKEERDSNRAEVVAGHPGGVQQRDQDYRISSGRKYSQQRREETEIGALQHHPSQQRQIPPEKYYQTFNEDDSRMLPNQQMQDQKHRQDQMESEELSDYPGDDMDSRREGMGEDMGESSQISPSQTTPRGRMGRGGRMADDMEGEDHDAADGEEDGEEYEHTRTENLRNFMEQAQPARAMLDSQGVSQKGANSSTAGPGQRRITGGGKDQGNDIGRQSASNGAGTPDARRQSQKGSHEKEGGETEPARVGPLPPSQDLQSRGHNNYAGLQRDGIISSAQRAINKQSRPVQAYRDLTDESSPDISQTDQPSQSSPSAARGFGGRTGGDDYVSSSLQESPESPERQELARQGSSGLQADLQNIRSHAQQLHDHLNQMNGNFRMDLRPAQAANEALPSSGQGKAGGEGSPSRSGMQESESLSPLRNSEL